MASAFVNHCCAFREVSIGNVHLMVASCCKDANRCIGSEDWMFGMTAERYTVVFMGEVPHSILVLIEGCTVWVSGVDYLDRKMNLANTE